MKDVLKELNDPVGNEDDDKTNETGSKLRGSFFSFFRITGRGEHGKAGTDDNEKQDKAGNNKDVGKKGRDKTTNGGKFRVG